MYSYSIVGSGWRELHHGHVDTRLQARDCLLLYCPGIIWTVAWNWCRKRDNTICVKWRIHKENICGTRMAFTSPGSIFLSDLVHCKKKVIVFPVTCLDVTNQTLPGRQLLNYSRTGRVWLVTSQPETGKTLAFFTVYCVPVKGIECR